jgi:hypothetical protein
MQIKQLLSPPQMYAGNSKKQNRSLNTSFLFYEFLHSMALNSLPSAHLKVSEGCTSFCLEPTHSTGLQLGYRNTLVQLPPGTKIFRFPLRPERFHGKSSALRS